MGGTQKASPRLPVVARPIPKTVRVYGHLTGGFDVSCPACRTLNQIGSWARHSRRRKNVHGASTGVWGYNPLTGVLVCVGCHRPWYVGLVLWGVARGRHGRPRDHVVSQEELAQLGVPELGAVAKVAVEDRQAARGVVNLVCWCGEECPAHPREEDEVVG